MRGRELANAAERQWSVVRGIDPRRDAEGREERQRRTGASVGSAAGGEERVGILIGGGLLREGVREPTRGAPTGGGGGRSDAEMGADEVGGAVEK